VKKELKALNKESKLNPELVNYYSRQIWKKYRDIADLGKNGIKQGDITEIIKRSIK
jgi:predicted outer membrane protein